MSMSPLSFQQPTVIHLFGWDHEEDVEIPMMFGFQVGHLRRSNGSYLTSLKSPTSVFSSPQLLQGEQYFASLQTTTSAFSPFQGEQYFTSLQTPTSDFSSPPPIQGEQYFSSLQTPTSDFSSPLPLQGEQYFTFVESEDSDVPPSDFKPIKKDQKIGRPPNSFLLFRRDFQAREGKKLPANSKRPTCASWSSKASAAWRELDATTRKRWGDIAATEKALHAQLYPDYKFKPNKRRKNEKNGPPVIRPTSAIVLG